MAACDWCQLTMSSKIALPSPLRLERDQRVVISNQPFQLSGEDGYMDSENSFYYSTHNCCDITLLSMRPEAVGA
jgi:hypothetical protein